MIDATATNAADVAIHRVSPLRLGDPGPSEEALGRIVSAGLRAPDHGQLRPWKFLLIRRDARHRFGELLAQSLRRRNPDAPEETIQAERAKPMRAPLIIVAAAALRASAKVPDVEQIVSTGAAIQNMLLAAHALGYGGFWRTGAPAYDRELITGSRIDRQRPRSSDSYTSGPSSLPASRNIRTQPMWFVNGLRSTESLT